MKRNHRLAGRKNCVQFGIASKLRVGFDGCIERIHALDDMLNQIDRHTSL